MTSDPGCDEKRISARTIGSILDVDPAAWDACAGSDNPFVSHAYLSALEASGAVSRENGFAVRHVVVTKGTAVAAVAPTYLKAHSHAEYGPDHGWDKTYRGFSAEYYPKLQVEVPFAPVTGPRLLVRPAPDQAQMRRVLLAALLTAARRAGVSSLHVTYMTREEWEFLGDAGLMRDRGTQLHWQNRQSRPYRDFDDFMAALRSRRRCDVKKERRQALAGGLVIECLTGDAIRPRHIEALFPFYASTNEGYGAQVHLNQAFFEQIRRTLADRILLLLVKRGQRYIAGLLNMLGGDTVYSRYWGAEEEVRFLHFETTYYRIIDYAIGHGMRRIDGGAGGPHKIARGYLPVDVYHAHWVREPEFAKLISGFLLRKSEHIRREQSDLMRRSPYLASRSEGSEPMEIPASEH